MMNEEDLRRQLDEVTHRAEVAEQQRDEARAANVVAAKANHDLRVELGCARGEIESLEARLKLARMGVEAVGPDRPLMVSDLERIIDSVSKAVRR